MTGPQKHTIETTVHLSFGMTGRLGFYQKHTFPETNMAGWKMSIFHRRYIFKGLELSSRVIR